MNHLVIHPKRENVDNNYRRNNKYMSHTVHFIFVCVFLTTPLAGKQVLTRTEEVKCFWLENYSKISKVYSPVLKMLFVLQKDGK